MLAIFEDEGKKTLPALRASSSDSVHAIRQRLQLAVEGKAELSLKDVGELLLTTSDTLLPAEEGE